MNDIIVGIGEVLWDVFPEGKRIGGAPANFAYHMSQFGFDSRVVSAVGEDVLGDEILENFNGKGLRYWVERVPFPTGIVEVTLDGEGNHSISIYYIGPKNLSKPLPCKNADEDLYQKLYTPSRT